MSAFEEGTIQELCDNSCWICLGMSQESMVKKGTK